MNLNEYIEPVSKNNSLGENKKAAAPTTTTFQQQIANKITIVWYSCIRAKFLIMSYKIDKTHYFYDWLLV